MAQDSDEDRIRRKAYELWEAEGFPYGRHLDHWEQAREIIATQDSYLSTLRPAPSEEAEPIEPAVAIDSLGDLPNLTDQGKDALTDITREPEFLAPEAAKSPAAEAPVDHSATADTKAIAAPAAAESAATPPAAAPAPAGGEAPERAVSPALAVEPEPYPAATAPAVPHPQTLDKAAPVAPPRSAWPPAAAKPAAGGKSSKAKNATGGRRKIDSVTSKPIEEADPATPVAVTHKPKRPPRKP